MLVIPDLTKAREANIVATIVEMGAESLSPEDYETLLRIMKRLTQTRHIDNEHIADAHIALSGKQSHSSDCSTSIAPAEYPLPCDCCFGAVA